MLRHEASDEAIHELLSAIIEETKVSVIKVNTVKRCWDMRLKYRYNYWDCLILASALENDCGILYTEDLQHGHVTPPYFLATKIEAFKGRGGGDYMASHDTEDIITVIDGRPEIVAEIISSPNDLKNYLAAEFRTLLRNSEFLDAIPGHLLPDRASQARLPRLKKCLEQISNIQDAA